MVALTGVHALGFCLSLSRFALQFPTSRDVCIVVCCFPGFRTIFYSLDLLS